LRKKWGIILAVICVTALVCAATVFAINPKIITVPTTGIITQTVDPKINFGVYSDSDCTKEITEINWGSIQKGSTTNITVYVKNTCTLQLTLLQNTTNWYPAGASNDLTFDWDYIGDPISPSNVAEITLMLSVASEPTSTSFSFDIVITGTQWQK